MGDGVGWERGRVGGWVVMNGCMGLWVGGWVDGDTTKGGERLMEMGGCNTPTVHQPSFLAPGRQVLEETECGWI